MSAPRFSNLMTPGQVILPLYACLLISKNGDSNSSYLVGLLEGLKRMYMKYMAYGSYSNKG